MAKNRRKAASAVARQPAEAPRPELSHRFFLRQWQEIHTQSLGRSAPTFQAAPMVIPVVAAFSLAFMQYVEGVNAFHALLRWLTTWGGELGAWASGVLYGPYRELHWFGYWSLVRSLGYMAIPWVCVSLIKGQRPWEYGLSLKSARSHLLLYVTLYLMVLPVVVLASFTAGFQQTYPFYSLASRSVFDFVVFELVYALQFFTLEFFFRGFLLHGLKRHIGAYAIFYMLVPYSMIHFGKPFVETMGAIGAGIILGTLSLRTGSIWGGVLIHIAVAVTMDLCALWQKGLL